jgi:hypothetical protein
VNQHQTEVCRGELVCSRYSCFKKHENTSQAYAAIAQSVNQGTRDRGLTRSFITVFMCIRIGHKAGFAPPISHNLDTRFLLYSTAYFGSTQKANDKRKAKSAPAPTHHNTIPTSWSHSSILLGKNRRMLETHRSHSTTNHRFLFLSASPCLLVIVPTFSSFAKRNTLYSLFITEREPVWKDYLSYART